MTSRLNIEEYVQQSKSIEVLRAVCNHPGEPISFYTNAGTDKTSAKRIREAERLDLLTLSKMPTHNSKLVYPTEKGHILVDAIVLVGMFKR